MAQNQDMTVALDGAVVEVKYGPCGCPPTLKGASSGPVLQLHLQSANAVTKGLPSNMAQRIESDNAFEPLPLPSNWEGRFVVIVPCIDTAPDFTIRLTFQDLTTSTIPVQGLFVLEVPRDNPITEVAVQGTVTIAWLVTGQPG